MNATNAGSLGNWGCSPALTFWDNSANAFCFRVSSASDVVRFDTQNLIGLTIRGDGLIQPNSPSFTANGSVATTMTSLGPAGASTTITKWLTIKDDGGTTRFIPCY